MSAAIATTTSSADPSAVRPVGNRADTDAASVAADFFSALVANLVASSAAGIGAVDAAADPNDAGASSNEGGGSLPAPNANAASKILVSSAAIPGLAATPAPASPKTAEPAARTGAPTERVAGGEALLRTERPIDLRSAAGLRIVGLDSTPAAAVSLPKGLSAPKTSTAPASSAQPAEAVLARETLAASATERKPDGSADANRRMEAATPSDGPQPAGRAGATAGSDPVASVLRELKGEVLPSNALRTAAAAHPVEGLERLSQDRGSQGVAARDAVSTTTAGRIAPAGSASQGQTSDPNLGAPFARDGAVASTAATARVAKAGEFGALIEGVERSHDRDKAAREIAELGHAGRATAEVAGAARAGGSASAPHRGADASARAVEIVQQVAEAAQRVRPHDGGSITLRLQPGELGRVDVKLEVVEGRVTATLTADRADVRGVIERNLGELHQALAGKGVEIQSLRVETQTHRAGDPFPDRQPDSGFEREPGGRRDGQRESGRERRRDAPDESRPRFQLFA